MTETKFEYPPPSPEEMREIRERMSKTVDSHALAVSFIAERSARSTEWAAAFEVRFGFDPRKTITELEGVDAGDGFDTADEPEVHALRRVPLIHWTADDTYLMLAYRHGVPFVFWLAVTFLEDDPMIEARHFSGDLLETAAKVVATMEIPPAASGERAAAKVSEAEFGGEAGIWRAFEEDAAILGLSDTEREAERKRLADGRPSAEPEQFSETVNALGQLAKARERGAPARALARAEAVMVYAVYRPRRGMEMVPARDLADPVVMAHLEHPDTFYFRRETRFDIVEVAAGVRLRHFSTSARENWYGIAFASEAEAMLYAESEFGVARSAWKKA